MADTLLLLKPYQQDGRLVALIKLRLFAVS
jgi:hypothetical protein